MGYPMTYTRVVLRNGLDGNYAASGPPGASTDWKRMVAGDMRRLEQDQMDDLHIAMYAEAAGISKPKARKVLEAFFTDFGRAYQRGWLAADEHARCEFMFHGPELSRCVREAHHTGAHVH